MIKKEKQEIAIQGSSWEKVTRDKISDVISKLANVCTQMAVDTGKYKFSELYPSGPSFFLNKIQNFDSCTQTAVCTSQKEIRNDNIVINLISFLKNGKKIKNMISR